MTLFCTVLTPFLLNYDVSYPKSHVTLKLDGVTSKLNIHVNICGTVKRLAGLLQRNGGKVKVKETEGLN